METKHLQQNNCLTPFLEGQGVVIIDGALATELEERGAELNDPLWSAKVLLEAPELIRQVHDDYFVAGANVAITATYQATFPGLMARGLTWDEAGALMQLSVDLAIAARDQYVHEYQPPLRPLVAASVGPYGAFLHNGAEYTGDYGLSVEALMDWHRPRFELLAQSGADLLACETIPSLAEGEALLRLLQETATVPAWLSFSCCDDEHVCHGERFTDCVAVADGYEQAIAVGLNCTPPRHVESLLEQAASVTTKPLVAYPNSGETWDSAAHCWVPDSGKAGFAPATTRWYRAGARLIGGCCRTGPAEIAALKTVLERQFR